MAVLKKITLEIGIEEGRITEDEGGIHITNWKLYQSEYDRQKSYRQRQKYQENIAKSEEDVTRIKKLRSKK